MISIVMAYVNRKPLLDFTLKTMTQSNNWDFEVIIVDDFSDVDQDPTVFVNKYPDLNINVIKMSDITDTKNYYNPCVPYNVGFNAVQGDKVIIQNPECCHMGDVISYVEENLTDDTYLSFHCYASTSDDLRLLSSGQGINYLNNKVSAGGCWYNHEVHRPESFHFTTAMTRSSLSKLNGFDERFAQGRAYDDAEFVKRATTLLEVKYVSEPHVIHQFHPKTSIPNQGSKLQQNTRLYKNILQNEAGNIKAHNLGKTILTETT